MTTVAVRRAEPAVWTAVAAGTVALAARPVGRWAIVVTLAVGLAGLALPIDSNSPPWKRHRQLAVLAFGFAVFLTARLTVDIPGMTPWALVPSIAAGVAEEAFFRRAVYGWLLRFGVPAAIIAGAALFALVHIPAYGVTSVAVNFSAGIIFGWQRWAAGTWTVPGATHAIANLVQVL